MQERRTKRPSSIKLLIVVAVLAEYSVAPSQVVTLPDPGTPLEQAGTRIQVNLRPSSTLPEPEYASSMAERVVTEIDRKTNFIQGAEQEAAKLAQRVYELQHKLDALNSQKARVMEDFRRGLFCSECHRSRTELGGDIPFWNHIAENARNGRHAVPASPEEIAAKEREFDTRLAVLDGQISDLTHARLNEITASQAERAQIDNGLALWKSARQLERMLYVAHEREAELQNKEQMGPVERSVSRLRAEKVSLEGRKPQDAAALARSALALKTMQDVRESIQLEQTERYSEFLNRLGGMDDSTQRDYAMLLNYVNRISGNQPYPDLPNVKFSGSISPLETGITGFGVSSGGGEIGATFKFGSYGTAGIQGGELDAATTEVKTFFVVFNKLKLEAGWQTKYTPNSVLNYPVLGIGVETPKPSASLKRTVIDEKPKSTLPKLPTIP